MSETQAGLITRFMESIIGTDSTFGIDGLCHSCWKRPRYKECPTFKNLLGNNRYLCKPCMKDERPELPSIYRVPPKHVRDRIKEEAAQKGLQAYLCECCSMQTRRVCIYSGNLQYEICSECAILINHATPKGKPDADSRQCQDCKEGPFHFFILVDGYRWACMDCFEKAVARSNSHKNKTLLKEWERLRNTLAEVPNGTEDYWGLRRAGEKRLEVLKEREGIETEKGQRGRRMR